MNSCLLIHVRVLQILSSAKILSTKKNTCNNQCGQSPKKYTWASTAHYKTHFDHKKEKETKKRQLPLLGEIII